MASKKFLTIIVDGAKLRNKQFDSHTEVVDFLGVRIGALQLPISEDAGHFAFGSKKLTAIADGAATTDAATKGQLDTGLGTKINSSLIGAANGVAPLDGDSKIAAVYLPSYVDDVLEFANLAAFPGTGESGKIYIALDTGKTYRWSGSAFVEIVASPGTTDNVTEGSTNLYFTEARVLATVLTGLNTSGGSSVTAADSILVAIGKLENRVALNDAKVSYSAATARSDLIENALTPGETDKAPTSAAVVTALAGKSDTTHTHIAANITDFASTAKTAVVVNSMAGSETDQAPSVSSVKTYIESQIGANGVVGFENGDANAISEGQFVYIDDNEKARKLSASSPVGPDTIFGIALTSGAAAEQISVKIESYPHIVSGYTLVVGQPVYASKTVPGSVQQNLTGFVAGDHVISLGKAMSVAEITFDALYIMEY